MGVVFLFQGKFDYEGQTKDLNQTLSVVKGKGAMPCGRNWLKKCMLKWEQIQHVHEKKCGTLKAALDEYSNLFKEELGTLKDIRASIRVKPEITPKLCKHRPLPLAMKERAEEELRRQRKAEISPVKHKHEQIEFVCKQVAGRNFCIFWHSLVFQQLRSFRNHKNKINTCSSLLVALEQIRKCTLILPVIIRNYILIHIVLC